jgi:hypothetical protein
VIVAAALTSCSVDEQEINRLSSPASSVEAVLTKRSGGGAAGVFSLRLYLVETQEQGKDLDDPVAVITGCDSVDLRWQSPRVLQLLYDIDCTLDIKTSWYSQTAMNDGQIVEYVIVPTLTSAAAQHL